MASNITDEEPTSLDYFVLHTTTDTEEVAGTRETSDKNEGQQLVEERDAAISKLCEICNDDKGEKPSQPLRIAIIGKHGAGKSSFINGIAAALSLSRWNEYARTGHLRQAGTITVGTESYTKCCNDHIDRYNDVLLPTLIDVPGLTNEVDDKLDETVRLLLYGHVQEDEPLANVYEECKDRSQSEIRAKYSQCYPDMRVDRVIFLASAEDRLPEYLMDSVYRAAHPSHRRTERRAVPIFGVLTKLDKVDANSSDYLDKKETFMKGLGLNQTRFLQCSNYCDDLDPKGLRTKQLDPKLDLPLIYFMQEVCNRAQKVVKKNEILPGSNPNAAADAQNAANAEKQKARLATRLMANQQLLDIMLPAAVGVVTLIFLQVFATPVGQGDTTLKDACKQGPHFNDLLCAKQKSEWVGFQNMLFHLMVAAILAGVVFLFRYMARRL